MLCAFSVRIHFLLKLMTCNLACLFLTSKYRLSIFPVLSCWPSMHGQLCWYSIWMCFPLMYMECLSLSITRMYSLLTSGLILHLNISQHPFLLELNPGVHLRVRVHLLCHPWCSLGISLPHLQLPPVSTAEPMLYFHHHVESKTACSCIIHLFTLHK
jgi:hypothetical protein